MPFPKTVIRLISIPPGRGGRGNTILEKKTKTSWSITTAFKIRLNFVHISNSFRDSLAQTIAKSCQTTNRMAVISYRKPGVISLVGF